MSVAFRRESDEEHLEPKFEIPIPSGPNLVTARGMNMIAARAQGLRTLLPTLTEETQISATKRDLRYWDTRQSTAELMPIPDGGRVAFGVTVTFLLKGKSRSIHIVGDDEADPANGLISFSAPLSRAIMGAEPGDVLAFNGDDDALEIISITI
ncbi:MAG: GreA/GreB family elongation factor [Sphingobium sp.]